MKAVILFELSYLTGLMSCFKLVSTTEAAISTTSWNSKREAIQGRPVVVVVTSRTVVADRVRIPEGATVVKLDPFSEDNTRNWVKRWNQ